MGDNLLATLLMVIVAGITRLPLGLVLREMTMLLGHVR